MKTIDTLVEDVYQLLENGTKRPNQEYLFGMGSAIMEGVRRQLWSSTSDRKPTLRMSNLGKPCNRALWYDLKGTHDPEPLTPQTKLKFMVGDVVEAVILYLVKEAGHTVEDQQKEVEIDGIRGHIDARIDGMLTDVKSSSSFGMKKFKNGTLPDDDPFGYISQMSGYANALGDKEGTFLAFDKSSGELATYTHSDMEDTSDKIATVRAALAEDEPPKRGFRSVEDRYGRTKVGINCSYCSHKKECWKDEDINLEFKSGRPVWYLGREKKKKAVVKNAF
jgi:hypothetical protein